MNNPWWAFVVLLGFGHVGAVLASDSLRIGSQVLTTGDSAMRVTELLGKPPLRLRSRSKRASHRGRSGVRVEAGSAGGERWQYRRGDHVTTITIVDGRVGNIEDRRQ